jgi:hypothetical protein
MIVAVLASGCSADDGAANGDDADDFMDMDTPPGNCSAGTTAAPCPEPGSSGSPEGGPCTEEVECAAGNACVAPFIDGEVGDFTCTSQCLALMDESAWCLGASACCDVGAVCSARGLCVEGGLDDSGTGTGSGTTGDGTTGTGTTGTGTDGSGSEEPATEGSGSATGTTGVQ